MGTRLGVVLAVAGGLWAGGCGGEISGRGRADAGGAEDAAVTPESDAAGPGADAASPGGDAPVAPDGPLADAAAGDGGGPAADAAADGSVGPCSGTRDPAAWPFASDSPWNMPIGSGATYADIDSPALDPQGGAGINCTSWSLPVYVASATDPLRTIYQGGDVCAQFRVPDAATPDPQSDGHLLVIDDTRTWVAEMWQGVRLAGGDLTASACVQNDIRGPGVYDSWHGVRAYGGSALAGLVRVGEVAAGIPHALAAATSRAAMNRNPSPFVWPASSADNGWETTYGTSGNVHMGTLLAIPPEVDVGARGLSAAGLAFGRALQDYGAYIVDAADANLAFYAEPAADGELPGGLGGELGDLLALVKVVTNNSATSVGGGGTPRRCLAPPFE